MNALTPKQAAFVSAYLLDDNGTKAAIAAGYGRAGSRVAAYRLLRNPLVQAEIQRRLGGGNGGVTLRSVDGDKSADDGSATPRTRGSTWMATRRRILARDGHVCQCDACADLPEPLPANQVDHKVPLWEGGADEDENLQALSAECHKRKTKEEAARRAASAFVAPEASDSPLGFLLGVMNDNEQDPRLRVRAAIAAAQYKHAKVGEGGKKDAAKAAAGVADQGRFGRRAPPKLVAVSK